MSGGSSDAHAGSFDFEDRQRLINARMSEGVSALENSRRVMEDIEETAMGISHSLASNRETINSAQRKVNETNSLSSRARGILRRMEANERFKKAFALGATGIVGFCVLLILYSMVFGL